MTIAEILKDKPQRMITVGPEQTLQQAAEVLGRERIGALLVLKPNGDIAGILSERDIVRAVGTKGAEVLDRPVAEMMTKDVTCCAPEDSIDSAMALMTARRFRHLPVRQGGRIVAMISIGDVVKKKVEDAEAEAQQLKEYIARG
ncbi:MAG: CBS domain-containing protein [Rhodospirillaceae bacterium]|nr:CBS domain-containing protein [Rhodospirillaceae bacterium]